MIKWHKTTFILDKNNTGNNIGCFLWQKLTNYFTLCVNISCISVRRASAQTFISCLFIPYNEYGLDHHMPLTKFSTSSHLLSSKNTHRKLIPKTKIKLDILIKKILCIAILNITLVTLSSLWLYPNIGSYTSLT